MVTRATQCLARDLGWMCTEEFGHHGDHAAKDEKDTVFHSWPNISETSVGEPWGQTSFGAMPPQNFDPGGLRGEEAERAAHPGRWNRSEYLAFFYSMLARMREITQKKNNDYGGAEDPFKNFREFGELGILVRMSDKWARIKTALKEKRELQVADESVEDTILDLSIYCLLLLAYRKGSGDSGK